jgi:hypothetical protein
MNGIQENLLRTQRYLEYKQPMFTAQVNIVLFGVESEQIDQVIYGHIVRNGVDYWHVAFFRLDIDPKPGGESEEFFDLQLSQVSLLGYPGILDRIVHVEIEFLELVPE